nr:MAG TPA: minor tail protein [Caudoviricetes sp.]
MGDSVGQVELELVLNKGDFEAGLNAISKLAAKAGKMLASAFAVKKIIDFGKECIELSSNLSEVQNVVDTVFPTMNRQIDNFAKNAAAQFGLSETMAKNFTGTFGAMGKAFGFSEGQAYDMATALTGLAGDVASFYNMSQDEAYTKLKSVFTGETESLKSLGVVMTQSALDAFAMANGFGKTTKSMSEAEKVALRFKFVQDQLSAAQGDFMRTSDGWANQVRLLSLQFDSLKAAIGSGLIAVLSPVVRMLNILIGRILTAISALKSFFSMLGGTAKLAINPKGVTAGTDAVAKSADKASGALGGAGGAAKKAAKDIKSATTGIDELNILPDQSDSSGGGGGGESGGGGGADFPMESFDTGAMEAGTAKIDEHLKGIVDKFNELKNLFMSGFWEGLGDLSVLNSIESHIEGIGKSLKGIFTSPEVLSAANTFAEKVVVSLGKIAGAGLSISFSFTDFLVGSIDTYLNQNSERIKSGIVKMFDIEGAIVDIQTNFITALADIFTVFRGDNFKQIGADLISIFADTFGTLLILSESTFRDIQDVILTPITELKDQVIETLNNLSAPAAQIFNDLADIFRLFGDTIVGIYDGSIHPLFTTLRDAITDVGSVFLNAFNTYILPVIQKAADKFTAFKDEVLAPLMPKAEEVFSKISECVQTVWHVIEPFVLWFVETAVQQISYALNTIVSAFFAFLSGVGTVIDGILTALNGLLDFIIGVFTGDWDRAWNGIKAIFDGIWKAIKGILETVLKTIYAILSGALEHTKKTWESVWKAVSDFFKKIFDGIKAALNEKMEAVKTGISTALGKIKENWEKLWSGMKTFVVDCFTGIWNGIKGTINTILSGVESMANGVINAINGMINALNSISFDIPDWVPEIGGNSFGLHIPTIHNISIPKLAEGGFVKANTPQLAMIGDNRHYGEVVAPENKLEELLNRAVSLASNTGISDELFERMIAFLSRISEQIDAMDLTVYVDVREIKQRLTDLEGRSGYSLRG